MARIWYSVHCWDDVGGAESGIVPVEYWEVFHAPTIFKAYELAKKHGRIPMWKYETSINPKTGEEWGYEREVPDVRIATDYEVSEYLYDVEIMWAERKNRLHRS